MSEQILTTILNQIVTILVLVGLLTVRSIAWPTVPSINHRQFCSLSYGRNSITSDVFVIWYLQNAATRKQYD